MAQFANWSPAQPVADDELVFDATGSAASSPPATITNIVSATTPNYIRLTYKALVGTGSGGYQTTEIAAGQTLNLKGNDGLSQNILYVGNPDAGIDANSQVYTRITGAGTLKINDAYDVLQVKQGFASDGTHVATLDMSGLNTFDCTLVGKIRIGYATGNGTSNDNRSTGTLKLAKNNFITVDDTGDDDFVIGFHGDNASSDGPLPALLLGETTTIYSISIHIGSKKSGGYIGFNTTAAFVNPKVTFRDKFGGDTRMTRLSVGDDFKPGGTGADQRGLGRLHGRRDRRQDPGTGHRPLVRLRRFRQHRHQNRCNELRPGRGRRTNAPHREPSFTGNSAGNAFGTLNVGGDSASSFGRLIVSNTFSMAKRGSRC